MEIGYKLLGVLAAIGVRLNRHRINHVPLSLLPLSGVVVFPLLAWGLTLELKEPKFPQVVSLQAIAAADDYSGPRYVTVQGRFDPATKATHTLRIRRTEIKSPLVAFVDRKAGGAVMVIFDSDSQAKLDLTPTSLTGMLRPIDGESVKDFPKMAAGLPVVQNHYLRPGNRPFNPGLLPHLMGGLSLLSLLYTIAFARSYVVFRPDRTAPTSLLREGLQLGAEADLRVSGLFFLQGYERKRFLSVPAHLGAFDDGSLVFTSTIFYASQNWFWIVPMGKTDHSGLWQLWIVRGSVGNLQAGHQYQGWISRPALRFTYFCGYSQTTATAVLSFADQQEQRAMLATLRNQAA